MVGPAYGTNAQADVPPPYEEPVYENTAEGEGPRMDAPPVQLLRGPEDGDRARLEQVTFNACRHCGKIYSDPDPQYSWSLYLFLIKTQKKFYGRRKKNYSIGTFGPLGGSGSGGSLSRGGAGPSYSSGCGRAWSRTAVHPQHGRSAAGWPSPQLSPFSPAA